MSPARQSVLVVDDDETLTRSFARAIRGRLPSDAEVLCAYSAEEALRVLESGRPIAAVWSDLQMPHADDGLRVLRAAASLHPSAILLMVTGDPGLSDPAALPRAVRVFHKEDAQAALDHLAALLVAS